MSRAGELTPLAGAGIEVAELAFAYAGGSPVLKGLSLSVTPGERLGIIGPSGAGKTSLLLHLNGTHLAQAGHVTVDGVPVTKPNLERIREWVGLVFQDPDDQLFTPTIAEDVAFGPRNLGLTEEEVASRVEAACAIMEVDHLLDRPPHLLSYGERRRAAIATVLSMRPRVMALDEPFANLSPGVVQNLIGTLRELSATLVIVSQEILPLLSACDRLALLAGGRIEAVGPTREIATDRVLLGTHGLDFVPYLEAYARLQDTAT